MWLMRSLCKLLTDIWPHSTCVVLLAPQVHGGCSRSRKNWSRKKRTSQFAGKTSTARNTSESASVFKREPINLVSALHVKPTHTDLTSALCWWVMAKMFDLFMSPCSGLEISWTIFFLNSWWVSWNVLNFTENTKSFISDSEGCWVCFLSTKKNIFKIFCDNISFCTDVIRLFRKFLMQFVAVVWQYLYGRGWLLSYSMAIFHQRETYVTKECTPGDFRAHVSLSKDEISSCCRSVFATSLKWMRG